MVGHINGVQCNISVHICRAERPHQNDWLIHQLELYDSLVVRTFETLSSSYLGIYDQFLNVTLATEMSTLSKVRA